MKIALTTRTAKVVHARTIGKNIYQKRSTKAPHFMITSLSQSWPLAL